MSRELRSAVTEGLTQGVARSAVASSDPSSTKSSRKERTPRERRLDVAGDRAPLLGCKRRRERIVKARLDGGKRAGKQAGALPTS